MISLHDLLSPIRRNRTLVLVIALLTAILVGIGLHRGLSTHKVTLYFTVVPSGENPAANHQHSMEGAERMAEAIAGWVKAPGFREEIIRSAKLQTPDNQSWSIENFKRKVSARKQNRSNVFYTFTFAEAENQHSAAVVSGAWELIKTRVEGEFNGVATSDFRLTNISQHGEKQGIPLLWLVPGVLLLGLGVGVFLAYVREAAGGKIIFPEHLERMFPEAPILRISEQIGQHDETFLEQFMFTFPSPRLVGVFEKAEEHFSVAARDSIDEERDTPVLLVKMGETKCQDLQNLKAIFGDEIGIIAFET